MEERREVVTNGPGEREVVRTDVVRTEPPPNGAEVAHVVRRDPHAAQRRRGDRLVQAVWLVFAVIEGLIAIRFVLMLLGANPNAGFAQFVYGATAPLVAPFVGLFGTPQAGGSVFELHSLVALVVYLLLAWVLVTVTWLLAGETRTAVTTTSEVAGRRLD